MIWSTVLNSRGQTIHCENVLGNGPAPDLGGKSSLPATPHHDRPIQAVSFPYTMSHSVQFNSSKRAYRPPA